MMQIIHSIWQVFLDTAFWLLIGLFLAGLIKAYIPEKLMLNWLGKTGFASVWKAALVGAPLPLCSCGVLPVAIGLKRAGASNGATTSFLISTPETSVDSVMVSYALLGPFMAVVRPIAAIFSAISTGLLVDKMAVSGADVYKENNTHCNKCDNSPVQYGFLNGMRFAFIDLLADIGKWLLVGIILAGLMLHYIPPEALSGWGTGFGVMLLMLVVGIPMYICATASTPIAAALLISGLSPGAVLVFMLAGPATNIAGLLVIARELGRNVLVFYILGIAISSVFLGLLTNKLIEQFDFSISAQVLHAHIVPSWLAWGSAILLLILLVPFKRL